MGGQKKKDEKIDFDFEISFFEGLLKKRPEFVPALVALGDAYTKRGDMQKGLAIDLRLAELRQDDPTVHYNLACSYSLLGLLDDAFRVIKKAILLGYEDFMYLRQDPDLENLRSEQNFVSDNRTEKRREGRAIPVSAPREARFCSP